MKYIDPELQIIIFDEELIAITTLSADPVGGGTVTSPDDVGEGDFKEIP